MILQGVALLLRLPEGVPGRKSGGLFFFGSTALDDRGRRPWGAAGPHPAAACLAARSASKRSVVLRRVAIAAPVGVGGCAPPPRAWSRSRACVSGRCPGSPRLRGRGPCPLAPGLPPRGARSAVLVVPLSARGPTGGGGSTCPRPRAKPPASPAALVLAAGFSPSPSRPPPPPGAGERKRLTPAAAGTGGGPPTERKRKALPPVAVTTRRKGTKRVFCSIMSMAPKPPLPDYPAGAGHKNKVPAQNKRNSNMERRILL